MLYDVETGLSELKISECFPEDTGLFRCVATNDFGESVTAAEFNVLPNPNFTDPPESDYAVSDELACLTDSDASAILPTILSEEKVSNAVPVTEPLTVIVNQSSDSNRHPTCSHDMKDDESTGILHPTSGLLAKRPTTKRKYLLTPKSQEVVLSETESDIVEYAPETLPLYDDTPTCAKPVRYQETIIKRSGPKTYTIEFEFDHEESEELPSSGDEISAREEARFDTNNDICGDSRMITRVDETPRDIVVTHARSDEISSRDITSSDEVQICDFPAPDDKTRDVIIVTHQHTVGDDATMRKLSNDERSSFRRHKEDHHLKTSHDSFYNEQQYDESHSYQTSSSYEEITKRRTTIEETHEIQRSRRDYRDKTSDVMYSDSHDIHIYRPSRHYSLPNIRGSKRASMSTYVPVRHLSVVERMTPKIVPIIGFQHESTQSQPIPVQNINLNSKDKEKTQMNSIKTAPVPDIEVEIDRHISQKGESDFRVLEQIQNQPLATPQQTTDSPEPKEPSKPTENAKIIATSLQKAYLVPKMETSIYGSERIERKVIGEVKGATSRKRVIKVQGHKMAAPHFLEPIQPQVVKEGATCVFSGRISGDPHPKVTWYWDLIAADVNPPRSSSDGKVQIQESHKVHMHYDEASGECLLIIEGLTQQDLTNVVCEASNLAGKATCTANLVVVREYMFVHQGGSYEFMLAAT